MAEEVETYLRDSLHATIDEEKKSLPDAMAKLKEYLEARNPSREKLYALHNLLTEWQRESKQSKSSFISRLSFTRSLKKLQQPDQNEASNSNHRTRDLQFQPPPQQETEAAAAAAYRWSSRMVDPNKVHGLSEKSMSLQRLLVSTKTQTQFKAIGIVGMRGIGKTTLAQVLFNMQEVKNHFLPRIWVCLSKQPTDLGDNRNEVVKRMLICLGLEDNVVGTEGNEKDLLRLLFALRLQLTGKRYLIVLDDVWSTDERFQKFCSDIESDEKCGERLAYGLPKGGCGGTVIVTTRAEPVAEKMVGEENVHRLPLSNDESCWKIFTDTVEEDGVAMSKPLEDLKDIILNKCAGLPLGAKMMGQIAHADLSAPEQ